MLLLAELMLVQHDLPLPLLLGIPASLPIVFEQAEVFDLLPQPLDFGLLAAAVAGLQLALQLALLLTRAGLLLARAGLLLAR